MRGRLGKVQVRRSACVYGNGNESIGVYGSGGDVTVVIINGFKQSPSLRGWIQYVQFIRIPDPWAALFGNL